MYLDNAQGDYHGTDRDHPTYMYVMNVCGPCNYGGPCTSSGGILCQYDNDDFVAVVAAQLTDPLPEWTVISPSNPSAGVMLHAQNGALCPPTTGSPRNVTFMFNCDIDAPMDGAFVVYEDATNICNYHVDFTHPNACPLPQNLLALQAGVTAGPFSLNQNFWAYYSIYVPAQYGELKLTLKQTSDDSGWVGMWVRRGAVPTLSSSDRYDNTMNSQYHTIEIRSTDMGSPLMAGTYYIGIMAQGSLVSAYTILAETFYCPNNCSGNGICNVPTKMCQCNFGFVSDEVDCSAPVTEATLGVYYTMTIRGTQKAYFRYQINDTTADQFYIYMNRSSNTLSALPALMVQYEDWPTTEFNNGIVRDLNTPSQTWELMVEPPTLQNGVWIVGVQGSADQFFTFSLWARLCDCPKCCSGHGTCQHALPTDYCICDAGYTGTADCSASPVTLNVTTPLNITVDANGGSRMFVIHVPYEFAIEHVDMEVTASRYGSANTGIRLYAMPESYPTESNYWFVSAQPDNQDAEIIVPHADLYESLWYVGVWNYANIAVNVNMELHFEGWCPCLENNGHCIEAAPATCFCNSGWQGTACDVAIPSSSSGGVETGGVVAMVIIFTLLGVAIGIFVKHKKPDLCEKDRSLRDHITNEDL